MSLASHMSFTIANHFFIHISTQPSDRPSSLGEPGCSLPRVQRRLTAKTTVNVAFGCFHSVELASQDLALPRKPDQTQCYACNGYDNSLAFTSPRTFFGWAPSAILTPISRVPPDTL